MSKKQTTEEQGSPAHDRKTKLEIAKKALIARPFLLAFKAIGAWEGGKR